MQRVDALEAVQLHQSSIVTVGMFDGVHRGHQQLIQQLVKEAHAGNHQAVVISFFPHPDVVLRGITGRYYLTTPEEKTRLVAALDVDVLVMHPFNEEVRHMRAAAFVDRLLKHLHMAALWASSNFAMGYEREGTIEFLTAQGVEKNFSVHVIEPVMPDSNGERISSTGVRDALDAGDVEKVTRWLGRPYQVSGEVVHGDKRGRSIGFPTANIAVWEQKYLPMHGVYACKAYLGDETFDAVTNVGSRPTFAGGNVTVEAHIFDFDRDIYGQTLTLDFIQHLRGEQKFSGIDALVAQIKQDAETARHILIG